MLLLIIYINHMHFVSAGVDKQLYKLIIQHLVVYVSNVRYNHPGQPETAAIINSQNHIT